MRLLLFHPGPARLDCGDCLKFITDLDRGEICTFWSTVDGERKELPQIRHASMGPPPCVRCPKGSPEQAKEIELNEKNWTALAHYRQAKAVGLLEGEKRDPIVRRNFATIDAAYQSFEALHGARLQASEFAKLFGK